MSRRMDCLLNIKTTLIVSLICGQAAPKCTKRTVDPVSTKLNCKPQRGSTVFWLKDDVQLIYDGKMIGATYKNDYTIDISYNDKNLVLKGTKRAYEGRYECKSMEQMWRLSCYDVTISSNSEVKSTTGPLSPVMYSKTVTSGETVDLWCNRTDDLTWYVVDEDDEKNTMIQGTKLQIRGISEDCGNVYKCKKDGEEYCTWKLNILPKLTISINGSNKKEKKAKRKEQITISCIGETSHKLRFNWRRREGKKSDEDLISDRELVFSEFGPLYNVTVSENSKRKTSNITFRSENKTKGEYWCEARITDSNGYRNETAKSDTVRIR